VDVFAPQSGQPGFAPNLINSQTGYTTAIVAVRGLSGSPASKRQTITTTVDTAFTFGSSSDDFCPACSTGNAAQFDSNFGIHIGVQFTGVATGTEVVTIDGLQVTVYYAGTSESTKPDQKLYDAVIVEEAGVQLRFGANGRPPKSSMGCVYEGSLVVDDIDHFGKACYSVPGSPDYMPTDVYFIDLPVNESLTYMGVVNNRMVVGTLSGLWRINYLPNEDDASFSRGRAFEKISDTVGIINRNCACLFTNAMGQQELAFVDTNGVFATNGYSIRKLSADLAWTGPQPSVFGMSYGGSIKNIILALVNDPRTQTLRMIKSTATTSYIGSYAARHVKQDGSLKWTSYSAVYSPSNTYNPKACICFRKATGAWVVTYAITTSPGGVEGGSVVREDSTDTTSFNPTMNVSTPQIITREILPGGLGGEAELNAIIIHGISWSTSGTNASNLGGEITIFQRFTNADMNNNTVLTLPGGCSEYFRFGDGC
jgi:hypothetical protein